MTTTAPAWIFFDVGWTLVDETPALLHYFEGVRAAMPNPGVTTARDLYARYKLAIREDAADPRARVLEEAGLPGGDWKRFGWDYGRVRPYRDAGPALRALRGVIRLGVVANQGPGLPERLDRWGFGGLFDLVLGSGDCGVKKPSPEIFALAAERAGSPSASLMMAGDRLDNDIDPAKRAGWQTAWVRRGDHGKLKPRDPAGTPDCIVPNLVRLAELFVPADRIRLAEQVDAAGAIVAWPEKEREKRLVLEYLSTRFEAGRVYSEAEVNRIIDAHHRFGDYALLRRELVDRGYLARDDDGRRYRRTAG